MDRASLIDAAVPLLSDFAQFAQFLRISNQDGGGYVSFDYDNWRGEQRQFHEERSGWDIVLKARQIGFSTIELGRDVHYAYTHEGVQVLIVHHDQSLCEQMFRVVSNMVDGLVERELMPKPKAASVREIVFAHNGSAIRVVEAGVTEKVADARGRSGTIHRLHATEVAFWRSAEATLSALMGALDKNGEAVVESTPNGASGKFYEMVQEALKGASKWKLHFFPWFKQARYRADVPPDFDPAPRNDDERALRAAGCDDEQIQWWREQLADPARGGEDRLKQEYPLDPITCFRLPGGAYVDAEACKWLATQARPHVELVEMVVTTDTGLWPPKHLGMLRVWERPKYMEEYVIGADVSEGVEGDESALDVSIKRTGETVATFATNTMEPGDFGLALAWVGRFYNEALVAPERNNHGHTVLRTLKSEKTSVTPYFRVYMASDGNLGWHTNPQTRPFLFDDLATALKDRVAMSPDPTFAAQSGTLVRGQNGKPAAAGKGTKGGAKDDAWVAKAIGWQLRQRVGTSTTGKTPRVIPNRQYEGRAAPPPEVKERDWRPGDGVPRRRWE